MIKAMAEGNGRTILVLGLSYGNLKKFHDEPGETMIRIDGKELGLPIDVLIFSGENDAALGHFMAQFIGPETKLHIDPRLKS